MSGIALILLFEGRGGPGQSLLAATAAAALPDDAVIAVETGSDPDRAFALRLWCETEAWPTEVTRRLIELPPPDGIRAALPPPPGADTAAALALSTLAGAEFATISHLLALDGQTDPASIAPALAVIRRRLMASGAACLGLAPTGRPAPSGVRKLPPVLRRFVLGRDLALEAAEGGTGDPGLVVRALQSDPASGVLRVPEGLLAPLPEAGLELADTLAETLEAVPETRRWFEGQLPALFAAAPPGARAAAAPTLRAAGLTVPEPPPPAPPVAGRARLRIHPAGAHRHRMPFSYPALAPLWEERAVAVADPTRADLILWAHPLDPATADPDIARAIEARPRTLALVSEEPFWDSLYSPDPLAAAITVPAADLGEVRLHQVNHHRSDIFAFDRIPYYLLTAHGFAASYGRRFGRNAGIGAGDWADSFAGRADGTVFIAEKRTEALHDVAFPGGDLIGLCAWRTRLALACDGATRLGASWQGGPTRFDLPDWHLDKLVRLDRKARLLSAVENTHQPHYLSEKLFDAFACGARPLYHASPAHGAHRLDLPEAAWVNLHGQSAEAAALSLSGLEWDDGFFAAYAEAQKRLAALFDGPAAVVAERARLGRALCAELGRLADLGPAA